MITNLNVAKKHNARGITLIALVITIIVLLILAGVSINGILGQGSIVNQAKEAQTQTNNKQEEEAMSIALAQALGENDGLSKENIQKALEDIIDPDKPVKGGENGPWLVQGKDGNMYNATEAGDISKVEAVSEKKTHKENFEPLSSDNTTILTDKLGNIIFVPKNFRISSESADNVPDGVVIEDKDGNQYVWVPVGDVKKADGTTVTIPLGRYGNFDSSSEGYPKPKQDVSKGYVSTTKEHSIADRSYKYYEFADDTESKSVTEETYRNTKAKDIKAFVKSANTNGGYYIGRYEAGVEGATGSPSTESTGYNPEWTGYTADGGGDPTMVCKSGQQVWNYITQKKAASLCRNMYPTGAGVESDLMNSYAWDTAIIFIQQCETNSSKYYSQVGKSSNGNTPTQTGQDILAQGAGANNKDEQCNIYDMAGSVYEWTTESYTNSAGPCVCRGGSCYKTSDSTSKRDSVVTSNYSLYIGFRSILYL